MGYLLGADVSKHQGEVNFQALVDEGFKFCICKASEGADYTDPRFAESMQAMRELNASGVRLYPGAYHFARPDNRQGRAGGETEGRWFAQVLRSFVGLDDLQNNFLPPALDFEKYSESDFKDNIPWIEGFLHVLEEENGRSGMVYTGPNIWKYEVGDTDQFVHYPLWEVKYSRSGANAGSHPPRMPTDTSKEFWPWTFWQWSGGGDFAYYGSIPGVGVVDVNNFQGAEEDLAKLANAGCGAGPDPEPTPEGMFSAPPDVKDLHTLRGTKSAYTARVQGLLLAWGYGPDGLVGSDGLPDGLSGDKTEGYLLDFKKKIGLPDDTWVTWETWWALTANGMSG